VAGIRRPFLDRNSCFSAAPAVSGQFRPFLGAPAGSGRAGRFWARRPVLGALDGGLFPFMSPRTFECNEKDRVTAITGRWAG